MFAVWLLPMNEDMEYLKKIVKNLSLEYDSPEFYPHVTVYGLVNTGMELINNAINYSITDLKPFKIRKLSLAHSNNLWRTVFIKIKTNKELLLINRRLSDRLYQYAEYNFAPHISLIYKNMSRSERIKIIKTMKIKDEFTLDKIAILKFSRSINEWLILKSIKLGNF